MKKFWRIRISPDIRKALESLKVNKIYINIMLEYDSDPMIFINKGDKKYICMCQNSEIRGFDGWSWCEDDDWCRKHNYIYCGEINLRNEKLKKINESIL